MTKKIYKFEAETEKLLELLTNSIYSNKEIFLRELISNASDAIDKARLKSITDLDYLWDNSKFEIKIDIDNENKTIIISDNWIGMTKDEIIKNIWTIAKSWTKEFIEKLRNSKEKNNLIWQFWVWFYSVFMIADKVEIETKSNENDKATKWISDWKGSFELGESNKKDRWTKIIIYVKDDEKSFLEEWKLKELIKKYSNYVQVPIMMKEMEDEKDKKKERKYEQINQAKSIWEKNKSEIKDEEYNEFYTSISYDFEKALSHIHLNAEWIINYKSILFIPKKKNMFYNNDDPSKDYGPKLFVQNVLILENAKDLLPIWLRFISWVVSTNDLPLNISREMLQINPTLEKIRKNLVKKIIEKIEFELKENKDYDEFLNNFSTFLKEGIYYESELREKLTWLVKFKSLLNWKKITFDEYLENQKIIKKDAEWKEYKEIFYVSAKNENEALANPYIDYFKENKIDVLLFVDPIDEWIIQVLSEYKWNKLVSITKWEFEIEEKTEKSKEDKKWEITENKALFDLIKNIIWTDIIEEIKSSNRLWDNLWALNTKEWWLTPQMEKMMKAMWQNVPKSKKILEINPKHKIFKLMEDEFKNDAKSEKLKDLILYTYEQAILLEWWELQNYKAFINRMNKFII